MICMLLRQVRLYPFNTLKELNIRRKQVHATYIKESNELDMLRCLNLIPLNKSTFA